MLDDNKYQKQHMFSFFNTSPNTPRVHANNLIKVGKLLALMISNRRNSIFGCRKRLLASECSIRRTGYRTKRDYKQDRTFIGRLQLGYIQHYSMFVRGPIPNAVSVLGWFFKDEICIM